MPYNCKGDLCGQGKIVLIQDGFKIKCSGKIGGSCPVQKNGILEVKPPFRQRKSPESQLFSGLGGGDKRDRTADLLNAIVID